MMTPQVMKERELLKRCYFGEDDAVADFDDLGYMRTIRRAVTEVVGSKLSAHATDELIEACAGKVFEAWHTLPLPYRDLREQIRSYASAIAKAFMDKRRDEQLKKKKT